MKLTFLGPSVRDPQNKAANPGRLVNCFREPVQSGGRTQYAVRSVPGMAKWTDFAGVQAANPVYNVRNPITYLTAIYEPDSQLNNDRYNFLYETREEGTRTAHGVSGATPLLPVGRDQITMGGQVTTGGALALWTTGTAVVHSSGPLNMGGQLTTNLGAIAEAGSVAYLDGYAILTEKNGRIIQWSQPLDFDNFPALNFATAESDGFPIIRGVAMGSLFVALKERSATFWQVTNGSGADAIAIVAGRELDVGLKAFRLLTEVPDGFAFCGSDGRVYVFRGGLTPISTPALESAMQAHEPRDMFYYEWRGHGFICVTFDDIPAWCYDTAMGEWHERSGPDGGAWDMRCATYFAGQWVFGGGDGEVYVASEWLRDGDKPLIREMVSGVLDTGREVLVDKVEIGARVGDGPIDITEPTYDAADSLPTLAAPPPYSATGAEPTPGIMVQISQDGGHNWGMIRTRSLGAIGRFETRIVLRNLGQFRRPCMKITLASPIDTPVYSDADIEVA